MCACSYRLAPESVFPAAFEDCVKATKYFLTNAAKFSVDPHRIGVVGKLNHTLLLLFVEQNFAMCECSFFGNKSCVLIQNYQLAMPS